MSYLVLLVDDNPDHRFLTRRALKPLETEQGVRVAVAEDGDAALAWLREQVPDLILLDIKMPRRDGFDVLREIRGDPRTARVRVVMLTSSENRLDTERARELGADDYVTKPLDARSFQAAVRDAVLASLATRAPSNGDVDAR